MAHERGCVVVCDDDVVFIAEKWVYVKTTAKLIDADTGEVATATGMAREPESKPKMDTSQTTGSASSYAGKRALGNLFAIDDTADSDQMGGNPNQSAGQPFIAACANCGMQYQFADEEQMRGSMCQCGGRNFNRVS